MTHTVRVRLDPTFGHDITRIRGRHSATTTELDFTPIFSLAIPLELTSNPLHTGSNIIPYVTFTANFKKSHSTAHATTLTETTRNLLYESGNLETQVDSLSRTVVQQSAATETLLNRLEAHTAVTQSTLEQIEEALLVSPRTTQFDASETDEQIDPIANVVSTHEQRHVTDLIDPYSAFWKELELFWQLQHLLARPAAVDSPALINRFAVLYALPRRVVTELSAIAAERMNRETDDLDPAIKAQLISDRGLEQQVWDYLRNHGVEAATIEELATHSIAEQFGDIWLLYVIRHLHEGQSVAELSGEDFLDQIGVARPDDLLGMSTQPELAIDAMRDHFTNLVLNQLYGPAFEVISLTTTPQEDFELTRTWYNTNSETSGSDHRLAVRRALIVRYFLTEFRTWTQLLTVRDQITDAIAAGIAGTPVSLSVPVFDVPTDRVTATVENSLKGLLGDFEAIDSREELAKWLNDPDYDPLSQS